MNFSNEDVNFDISHIEIDSPRHSLALMPPANVEPLNTAAIHLYYIGFSNDETPLIANAADTSILRTKLHVYEDIILKLTKEAALLPASAILVNAKWSDQNEHQLLHFLSEHTDLKYIPVIVISERIHLTEGANYIKAKADDYYTTDVPESLLLTRINFLLRYKHAIIAARTTEPASKTEVHVPIKIPFLKRIADIALSAAAILFLSPLMILTALAIRIESKGPVVYKSRRVGAGYKEFNFWKFRSMYANADQLLEKMKAANQYGEDAKFVKFSNDPRITSVGRFIRKYSIDELPQLFNILAGEMSIVGNRPLPVYEAEQLFTKDLDSCSRFLAPAGLTGLWQVEKRGQTDMSSEERIALDVRYANEYNFSKDLSIIFKTFTAFIQKENV